MIRFAAAALLLGWVAHRCEQSEGKGAEIELARQRHRLLLKNTLLEMLLSVLIQHERSSSRAKAEIFAKVLRPAWLTGVLVGLLPLPPREVTKAAEVKS